MTSKNRAGFQRNLSRAWAEADVGAAATAVARPFVRPLRDFGQDQLAKHLASVPSAPNQSFNAIARKGQLRQVLARLYRRRDAEDLSRPTRRVLECQIARVEERVQRERQLPRGRVPSEKTLRRSLDRRGLGILEDEMAHTYEEIFALAQRNGILGPVELNTLDSTYLPSCGHAREQIRQRWRWEDRAREGRERGNPPGPLRTEAALAAHLLPPGTFKSTELGYQWHILATHGRSGQHYARRILRRRLGVGENPAQVVEALLKDLPGSSATWNLADKWFSSAGAIAAFKAHAERTGSKYVVAVPRSPSRKKLHGIGDGPEEDRKPVSRSIRSQAQALWEKARPAEGTYKGFFVAIPWRISLDDEIETTLFIYYRSPGFKSSGEPKEPEWKDPYSYIAFFTNAAVTPQNARSLVEKYTLRWNIENFIKDVKHWTTIAPTHRMFGRDVTFLLGFALLSLHSLFRDRFKDSELDIEALYFDKSTFFFMLQIVLLGLSPGD